MFTLCTPRALLLGLLTLILPVGRAHAQAWQWATPGAFNPRIALTPSGHTYIEQSDSVDLILRKTWGSLARFDATGRPAGKLLSVYNGRVGDIVGDPAGNVYAVVEGTSFTTRKTPTADTTFAPGTYLLKWNAAGELLWAHRGTGAGNLMSVNGRQLRNLVVDDAQRLTLFGTVSDNSTFTIANTSFGAAAQTDVSFVMQFDAAGQVRWSQQLTGGGFYTLTAASNGALYLLGGSRVSFSFGGTVIPAGSFWLRLDADGMVRAQQAYSGNIAPEEGMDLAIDAAGDCYLLLWGSELIWRNVTYAPPTPAMSNFVMKLTPTGAIAWLSRLDAPPTINPNPSYARSLCVTQELPTPRVLVGGMGSVVCGAISLDFNNGYHRDSYVLALNGTSGQPQWVVPAAHTPGIGYLPGADSRDEYVADMAANTAGEVWVAGLHGSDGSGSGTSALSHVGSFPMLPSAGYTSPFTYSNGYVAKLLTRYNQVPGVVFTDANSNRQFDATETGRPDMLVELRPTGLFFPTDSGGRYNAITEIGAYSLSIPNPPIYYNAVVAGTGAPTTSTSVSFSTYGNTASARNFALQPIGDRQDLQVLCTAVGRARPGFPIRYRLTATNPGTVPVSGASLRLDYDAQLAFGSASLPPATSTATSLSWSLGTLQPNARREIDLTFTLAATAPLGDSLRATATLEPRAGDLTPANNVETATWQITGSYDPNDISVNRSILSPLQVQAATPLDYTVRFENMGTDTAFTVLVRDTLPVSGLQLSALRFVASSHPFRWHLSATGVLELVFANILLPARSTNAARSQGFVRFQLRPQTDLVLGDVVANRAEIYFDFNTPVTTNTALTTVAIPTGLVGASPNPLAASAWPNPAHGTLHLTAAPAAGDAVSFTLLDAQGRPVRTAKITGTEAAGIGRTVRHAFDLTGLAPGLYLVQGASGGQRWGQRIVVK